MFVYKYSNNLAHYLQSYQDSLQPYYENVIVLVSFNSLVQNCVKHYSLSVTVFNVLTFLFVAVIFTRLLCVLLYNILLCYELMR